MNDKNINTSIHIERLQQTDFVCRGLRHRVYAKQADEVTYDEQAAWSILLDTMYGVRTEPFIPIVRLLGQTDSVWDTGGEMNRGNVPTALVLLYTYGTVA